MGGLPCDCEIYMQLSIIHPSSLTPQLYSYTDIFFVEALVYQQDPYLQDLLNDDQYRKKPIMLDHSAFLNNGTPIPLNEYLKVIEKVRPTHVILPDALGSFQETLTLLNDSYGPIVDMQKSLKFKLIGCLQGKRIPHLQVLLDSFTYPYCVDLIGITTKDLPEEITTTFSKARWRSQVLTVLSQYWSPQQWSVFKFHALGLVTARELVYLSRHPNVVSNDSSLATTSGLAKIHPVGAPRQKLDFFVKGVDPAQVNYIVNNINVLRTLCQPTE